MAPAKETTPTSLTKAQIIAQLAERNDLTKKQVTAFLESFVELAYREPRRTRSSPSRAWDPQAQ